MMRGEYSYAFLLVRGPCYAADVTTPAPSDARYTAERYFQLVDEGLLGPDDRVELLEGVIVAMAPHSPPHASAITRVQHALARVIGDRGVLRVQLSFAAGAHSVPEPDLLVAPGRMSDYDTRRPTSALLVVEIADSSLAQDRITKAAIYAAAGVPEYWLVNLRDRCVEVFRSPDRQGRCYQETRVTHEDEAIGLVALADARVAVHDLLPHGESGNLGA